MNILETTTKLIRKERNHLREKNLSSKTAEHNPTALMHDFLPNFPTSIKFYLHLQGKRSQTIYIPLQNPKL